MSQSQVVSFRASGHFLNWIETQRLDGESVSQAAQRILKEMSGVSTALSTPASTQSSSSVMSTEVSTITPETVDKLVSDRFESMMERMATIEERLGKLSA
jgi:hypothetical protein